MSRRVYTGGRQAALRQLYWIGASSSQDFLAQSVQGSVLRSENKTSSLPFNLYLVRVPASLVPALRSGNERRRTRATCPPRTCSPILVPRPHPIREESTPISHASVCIPGRYIVFSTLNIKDYVILSFYIVNTVASILHINYNTSNIIM